MNKRMMILVGGVGVAAVMAWTTGCGQKPEPGVGEKTGAALDRAAEKTGEAATKAVDATKDAAEKVSDKTGEVLEKSGAAVEKTGQDMQK